MPAFRHPRRQRGVAVITALLLTTLAISIVASLFWQQQVQVRSMENQRLHLQTRWILRGALDWSTLVLRQDAYTNRYTALNQVWATPLAETRLDQYIERERVEGEVFDASLSGNIVDATSRYNLRNLESGNRIDKAQLEILQRLLTNLQINPALAKTAANLIAGSQPVIQPPGQVDPVTGQEVGGQERDPSAGGTPGAVGAGGAAVAAAGSAAGNGTGSGDAGNPDGSATIAVSREGLGTPIKFLEVEDLLAVRGMTPEMLEKLRPFVIVLPERTPINVNTASAEVLAAVIPNFSLSEANALLARRRSVPWTDIANFQADITGHTPVPDSVDVKSNWFLVNSYIRLDRAALNAQSLVQRSGNQIGGGVKVVWVRQN
ncbi:type II secretion system minor pseudopilin GspK [Massilia litorea]|uniref:Type II secretion system minor pseudopilin GspK n=1 Tax=Massilia litorea TaxID=2769491 RepID=A0A7L9U842_9BURK|nr:type II secretion system minor pseudopilin GspK [Massilia litorea]QOL51027.1 type II secretion system minor pseudopilin GspK [Massilia litorea]